MRHQTVWMLPCDKSEAQPLEALFNQEMQFFLPCDEVTYCFERAPDINEAQHLLLFFNSRSKAQWLLAVDLMEKFEQFPGTKLLVDLREKRDPEFVSRSAVEESADLREFILTGLPATSKKDLTQVLLHCIVAEDNLQKLPYWSFACVLGLFAIVVTSVYAYVRRKVSDWEL